MDGSVATEAAATAIQAAPPGPVVTSSASLAQPSAPVPSVATPGFALSVLLQACPRHAQYALGGLLLSASILLAVHAWHFLPFGARPAALEPGEPLLYRLDLNHAPRPKLLQLPGVGPKLADRILDFRVKHGPFHSVADLAKVPGIGPMMLKRLEGWVQVEGEADPPPAASIKKTKAAAKAAAVSAKAKAGGPKININTALAADLQKLPRIGAVLSQRIIIERSKHLFKSVDELKRVKGIGQKTLDGLRAYATVGN